MQTSSKRYTENFSPIKVIAEYDEHTAEQIYQIISKTDKAFSHWKELSDDERGRLIKKMSLILRKRKEEYATLITSEMGKIISESRAEVEKCAWLCEYYADHAEKMLQTEIFETDGLKSYVRFDPVGVIYAIMPWNFPFWQVLRFAVPTIMAGNTVVLKHAPNVTGCSLAIERLFTDADFPESVFRSLIIPVDLSEGIIANPLVQGVTLTGSQRAGSIVAFQAGKYLKKSVMELGGSDPYIVLKDAEDAVRIANDTAYGLGASIWTQNIELAEKMAAQLDAGAVFINGMTKSDPRLPFGGTKQSGYGRELSYFGIREFVNIKTVWVK